VLAANSPLRATVVAMAVAATPVTRAQPAQIGTGVGVPGVAPQGRANCSKTSQETVERR
jgi:hypothetical protein